MYQTDRQTTIPDITFKLQLTTTPIEPSRTIYINRALKKKKRAAKQELKEERNSFRFSFS